jgi:hypothetical protein
MLFMQQITTFDASANMAPWYIKPVISGFVGQIKVGADKARELRGRNPCD